MKVKNHRLCQDDDTPYPFIHSPNCGGKVKHEYLVMHYTAGRDFDSAVKTLINKRSAASAHVVIGRDGSIAQLVPFDTIAWHAGQSAWQGLNGMNKYSLGIELDNAGPMMRAGDGWHAWFGQLYPPEQVTEAIHKNETVSRGWHLYTPVQLMVALEVAETLVEEYELKDVIGHDDIAPRRKTDPGPAFPLLSFRSRIFGRKDADEDETVYRTTVDLNIRSGPGAQFSTLSAGPLPKGARLRILDSEDTWRRVLVLDKVKGMSNVEGWINGRYIEAV